MVNNSRCVKEIIIQTLKEASGPVSGTIIGDNCGISRVAVWKNIKGLTAEGYDISSSSGGYQLNRIDSADTLLKREFPERKGKIHIYPLLDSTMTKARELARHGAEHMSIAAAEEQSAGCGRLQSRWESRPGGLYFTLILRPPEKLHMYHLFTLAAAAGICRFLDYYSVKGVCRWPNEIYADNRKTAGILTEVSGLPEKIDYILLGIGVNVNNKPGEGSTSMKQITGREIPVNSALGRLLTYIEETVSLPVKKIPALWESFSDFSRHEYQARKYKISLEGNLLAEETDKTIKTLYPGE